MWDWKTIRLPIGANGNLSGGNSLNFEGVYLQKSPPTTNNPHTIPGPTFSSQAGLWNPSNLGCKKWGSLWNRKLLNISHRISLLGGGKSFQETCRQREYGMFVMLQPNKTSDQHIHSVYHHKRSPGMDSGCTQVSWGFMEAWLLIQQS